MTEILTETLHIRRLEAKAESAALEHGMLAIRADDGTYQLINLLTRKIAGARFESPLDVLAFIQHSICAAGGTKLRRG
jgi:hypothetical protein